MKKRSQAYEEESYTDYNTDLNKAHIFSSQSNQNSTRDNRFANRRRSRKERRDIDRNNEINLDTSDAPHLNMDGQRQL